MFNILCRTIRRSHSTFLLPTRNLSTSPSRNGPFKAIIYSSNGNPTKVLSAATFPALPPLGPKSLLIEYLLSPINPADINVIEGVYPSKPKARVDLGTSEPVFIGGSEGVARVVQLGEGTVDSGIQQGDWVIMSKPQMGTWASQAVVDVGDVIRVPRSDKSTLSVAQAATLSVNPHTAWGMLHSFVNLQPGDWVIQNGANSAVGQAVIQIAKELGLKTINFVRNREDIEDLRAKLRELGATHILTYDELFDKSAKGKVKEWTQGNNIRLGLNCVGGKETSMMATLLGQNAYLVSYGAMSKQPLSLPTSLFIFKNLTATGYWQTRWHQEKPLRERLDTAQKLIRLMEAGKLREPEHEIITLNGTDEQNGSTVRDLFSKLAAGKYGKKVLLRFAQHNM